MTGNKIFFLFLFLATLALTNFFLNPNGETIENPVNVEEEIAVLEREEEEAPDMVEENEPPVIEEIEQVPEIEENEPPVIEEIEQVPEVKEDSVLVADNTLKDEPSEEEEGWIQEGEASWYGGKFHGRTTANGETYNMYELTAAHKELEFGTVVRVTHSRNGRSVDVRINDRGPFIKGRIIDLSMQAAQEIGLKGEGIADVKVEIIESP